MLSYITQVFKFVSLSQKTGGFVVSTVILSGAVKNIYTLKIQLNIRAIILLVFVC
jgi:hypothetical protein